MMKTNTRSQWKIFTPMAVAVCLMTACSDGDDGKEGPPGIVSISIEQADTLKATIENVVIDAQTHVQVDFFLSNANGIAVTGLENLKELDTLGVGIAKLAPPQEHYQITQAAANAMATTGTEVTNSAASATDAALQWTSYINNQVEPATNAQANAQTQWQAGIESNCKTACLTSLGAGQYRYTLSKPLTGYSQFTGIDTQYSPELTHRIYLELKPFANSPIDTQLINSVYDFVPATGQTVAADMGRKVIAPEQACFRCHNPDLANTDTRLLMHGNKRFAFEGCVVCHTTYSGDPETGNSLDMATLTHQIHQAKYQIVGYKGQLYDYANVTFPGDMAQCQQCHIPGATAQSGNSNIPSKTACLDCHKAQIPADWNGTVAGLFHNREIFATPWALGCSGCHPDSTNPEGVGLFHNAAVKTATKLVSDYQVKLLSSQLSVEAKTLAVTLQVQQMEQLPASQPMIKSFWLIATGETNSANMPINNGQRKVWDLLANRSDVALKITAPNQLTVTISNLSAADFGDLSQSKLYSKLVLCADKNTGFAVNCNIANQEVSLSAINSLSLQGQAVTAKAKVDEQACRQCHDQGLEDRVLSAHQMKGIFEPNSSCGTCHAPQTATALTDGQCQSCHSNDAIMYLNANVMHTPGASQIKPYRTINNTLSYREMVHSLHAGTRTVVGFDNPRPELTYPNAKNNCSVCHSAGQLSLEGLSAQQSLLVATPDAANIGQIAEYSPTLATCTACHTLIDSLVVHARSFGGVYQSDASGGRIYQSGQESCATCHAEGRSSGVDKVHK
ncbi:MULTISPECIES: OmcA/MtrC family decaheme c-type cytochrome [unclassified Shewanella]|uniref:OmcA/MtrC family decaheme c-type cytochrome n=1 Tax=unclassified Shewanella TaxID=196818 RepID=UPI0015643799|nr:MULTISPECIES: OmcA/MtrC family decaheme c-type cytochrome [unclassified Shewanella]MBW3513880.1 OmcA/MtrC family decaheme c-type cytochrome [Shewanella sp. NKUCC01_JLK]NRD31117.1 OmcA/MtrC family decaheme c-type cytochrome [Shewanella sp. DC2-4]